MTLTIILLLSIILTLIIVILGTYRYACQVEVELDRYKMLARASKAVIDAEQVDGGKNHVKKRA